MGSEWAARNAYERGRWIYGAQNAVGALVVTVAAAWLYASLSVLALGLLAVVGVGVAGWAHRDYLRGALHGVALGAVQVSAAAFMLTIGMRIAPSWCDTICFSLVLLGSTAVGLSFAAVFAGARAPELGRGMLALTMVGGVAVAQGCLPGSVAVVLGSVVGVGLGYAPGRIVFRASAAVAE